MLKKTIILCMAGFLLSACASEPRITNASDELNQIRLMAGMATQVEAPDGRKIESAVIGDPSLADLDVVDNVLNIFPNDRTGETNLIMRAADEDGNVKIYQYLLVVYKRH